MKRFLAIVLLGLVMVRESIAVTVTISNNTTGSHVGTFTGVEETEVKETSPTTNWGTSNFEVTKYDVADHTHAVIRFTGLSNIPGSATITSVTFGIWRTSGTGVHLIDLRRLLRNWVEAQATWNIYSTGNNWGTAGGISNGTDRTGTASGQLNVNADTTQFYTVTQASGGLVDDVQAWVNGSVTNNGWHLERNGTGNDNTSSQYNDSSNTDGQRPFLDVTYTTGGGGAGIVVTSRQRRDK